MSAFGKGPGKDVYFNEHNYRRDGGCRDSNAHYHRQLEIYYLTEGAVATVVDSRAFHLEKGGILVIPPFMSHSTIYDSANNSRIVVNFNLAHLPRRLANALTEPFYVERQPLLREKIDFLFQTVKKEYENDSDYDEISLISSISMLTVLLLRARTHADSVAVKSDFIEKAIAYIQKHYDGHISISAVAKHCGVTHEHLSRSFKQKTGLNFNEYLRSCRMNHAEIQLLTDSTKSVTEIAYGCGFNDSNYFSSSFKRTYGVTPTEFRRLHQGTEELKR